MTLAPTTPISEPVDVLIADGTAESAAIDLRGRVPVAIAIPASWTTANITFLACTTVDGTFLPLYDADGSEVAQTGAASSVYLALNPADFYGVNYLKMRSGTAGTPVNQSGDITLELMLGRHGTGM